jgi:hypothetical protein
MRSRDLEGEIRAAQTATQSGVKELLSRHEAKVLSRLVSAYKARDLTPEDAKVGVAIISELRSIITDADRAVERGADALKQMTGTSR